MGWKTQIDDAKQAEKTASGSGKTTTITKTPEDRFKIKLKTEKFKVEENQAFKDLITQMEEEGLAEMILNTVDLDDILGFLF